MNIVHWSHFLQHPRTNNSPLLAIVFALIRSHPSLCYYKQQSGGLFSKVPYDVSIVGAAGVCEQRRIPRIQVPHIHQQQRHRELSQEQQ